MTDDVFESIEPMKAKLSDVEMLQYLDNNLDWGAGEKFDGYRELLYLGRYRNEMLSSLGTSHIAKVPQFMGTVEELAGTILDCEGLSPTRYLEDNASCFKADPVNTIAWQKQHGQAELVAFDILAYQGKDTTQMPFRYRIDFLRTAVTALRYCAGMPIKIEQLVYQNKVQYYRTIIMRTQSEGHEGVILKNLHAPYEPGRRSPNWLKVKRKEMIKATIISFTPGFGKFEGMIGSVVFDYQGITGSASGMDDEERAYMTAHQEEYIGKLAYFEGQSITRYGALRHPQYKGVVDDSKSS